MLIDSPQIRRAFGWLAAFALPVAVVQVVGFLAKDAGPARLHAAVISSDAGISPAEEALRNIMILRLQPAMTETETRVQEHIQRMRLESFGQTPMMHAMPDQDEQGGDDTPANTSPRLPATPQFQFQAIMSATETTEAMALINNRPHMLGQMIHGTDWILSEIHTEERRIVISHPESEQSITLTLKTL